MFSFNASTKSQEFQNQYKGREARPRNPVDSENVVYDVLQNGKVIVANYVLPNEQFHRRYN
jgi:hypothetical protein